jgi:opacity protein-like surface antigen
MKNGNNTLHETDARSMSGNTDCRIAAFPGLKAVMIATFCSGMILMDYSGLAAEPLTNASPAVALDVKPAVQQSTNLWQGGIGSGMQKGAEEVSFALGTGIGMSDFGGKQTHDLVLGRVGYGRVLTDVVGGNCWLRGNLEGVVEFFGAGQYYPNGAYLFGLTPLLRYNIATGSRWMPFVEGGAGVSVTDIGRPDLGSVFEFNDQAGVGCHYFLKTNLTLTLQYRFMHISNAGIAAPNLGVNSSILSLGLCRFF